jgi:hypothetical protein
MPKAFRLLFLILIAFQLSAAPQLKWFKFKKSFVEQNFFPDSALGELVVSSIHPAKQVHSISCGGNDGELHIGIAEPDIERAGTSDLPVSGHAEEADSHFGIVAEPPNASSALAKILATNAGQEFRFFGYYRVWNEGHDIGAEPPSNPHHVLEVHPAWGIRFESQQKVAPNAIFPMTGYQGYGASKFVPLLSSVPQWLKVAEDSDFVYVQLVKAENFYQLPVTIREVHPIGKGIEAVADVYSDSARTHLTYSNLHIVAAAGTATASQIAAGQNTYLLGIFSVNLRKAMAAANGHEGSANAVSASEALEFFSFGVPKGAPVSTSAECAD